MRHIDTPMLLLANPCKSATLSAARHTSPPLPSYGEDLIEWANRMRYPHTQARTDRPSLAM
jgi:hypothetical protein